MKEGLGLFILITLIGCKGRQPAEIRIPDFQPSFYVEALNQLNQEIEGDPTNFQLIEQKLFYCEEAGWPATCLQALDVYHSEKGMSKALFQNYFTYYSVNEKHQEIINLSASWRKQYSLTLTQHKSLINSLVTINSKNEALWELSLFLRETSDIEIEEFTARQYLTLGDTLKSVYYYSKVYNADSSNHSMLDYGHLLLNLEYDKRGIEVLEKYYASQSDDENLAFSLASMYQDQGYHRLARNKLMPFIGGGDSVSFVISSLYQEELLFDSAVAYLDSILINDPTNFKAIKKKAEIYDQKGWLSTSLKFYEEAYAMDSTDTVIENQIASIQRKIAYLQRRKFEESKPPLLQLESKKIDNE